MAKKTNSNENIGNENIRDMTTRERQRLRLLFLAGALVPRSTGCSNARASGTCTSLDSTSTHSCRGEPPAGINLCDGEAAGDWSNGPTMSPSGTPVSTWLPGAATARRAAARSGHGDNSRVPQGTDSARASHCRISARCSRKSWYARAGQLPRALQELQFGCSTLRPSQIDTQVTYNLPALLPEPQLEHHASGRAPFATDRSLSPQSNELDVGQVQLGQFRTAFAQPAHRRHVRRRQRIRDCHRAHCLCRAASIENRFNKNLMTHA